MAGRQRLCGFHASGVVERDELGPGNGDGVKRLIVMGLVAALLAVTPSYAEAKAKPRRATFSCPARQATVTTSPVVAAQGLGQGVDPLDATDTQNDVRQSLYQSQKYVLAHTRVGSYSTGDSVELAVRVPAMAAFAVAAGLRTQGYSPTTTGVPNSDAKDWVASMVGQLACQHKAVADSGGWGRGWQTAHWAYLLGTAAWMDWSALSTTQRNNVSAVVLNEANYQSNRTVPYWKTPSGVETNPGDSKAEENAWNAELLWLAYNMMPSDDNAVLWKRAAVQFAVSAYSVQAENTSGALVNGVSLSSRLNGFNILDSGAVINHHFVHPDYANQIQMLWQSADLSALGGTVVPEAFFHGGSLVYSGLSTVSYVPGDPSPAGGTYVAPGGTVYVPDSSQIYFPQGTDWGAPRMALWVSLDAHADAYKGYMNLSGLDPATALSEHESGQEALVASSGATDGRTYSVDPSVAVTQDSYPGREEYAAENMASAWLAIYFQHNGIAGQTTGKIALP